MKARLLKISNFPGMLLLTLLAVTVQSTLFNHPAISFFQPDLILFMLIWISIKRGFIEGGILTLLLGYLVEINSSTPRGFFLCVYMLIFMTARILSQHFQIINKTTLTLAGLGFSVVMRVAILFFLYLLNRAEFAFHHTIQLLAPTILSHSLLIFPAFKILQKFDNITLKNPDAERRHERNFYLDEEWV